MDVSLARQPLVPVAAFSLAPCFLGSAGEGEGSGMLLPGSPFLIFSSRAPAVFTVGELN